jgi:hypothetical protein
MICKNCGKEFFEKYSKWSSGNFCSKFCGISFASKHNNNKPFKKVNCITCGKEIEVDKRASPKLCKCHECKKTYCKYCGQKTCLRKDICKKYQIFPTLIKYFGFDKTKIGSINVYEEFEMSINLMKEEYFDNKLSLPEMSKKYKCDFTILWKIFKSLNIKLRSRSKSVQNAIMLGIQKNNNIFKDQFKKYQRGWYTTWNDKQIFYRSSYEIDYCKELDEKKINYEVEQLRILYWDSQLLKQRVAIPDFYLPDTNEIIEIKSDWTYDEQNMKDKFKAYKQHGYIPKLILEHIEINGDML